MHLRRSFSFYVVVISFFILSPVELFAQKDLPITVESGIIPPEFHLNNDTILIAATGNPFYGNYMKKHFRKNYTGQYILAKNIEAHSVENCRYVMYEGTTNTLVTTVGGVNNGIARTVIGHGTFYIVDRKTGKQYVNPNIASPKLVKAYIKGLDEAR